MIYRISLFLYANYEAPPYYTYWRITAFTVEAPDSDMVQDMESELMSYAEEQAVFKGWTLSRTVKREIEQVYENERGTMPFDEPRISVSHGRFPNIPDESYIGYRQSRLNNDDDNNMEDNE